MRSIANIDESEMFRTFNMGIGMIIVVSKNEVGDIKQLINIREIGHVKKGKRGVQII